MSFGELLSLMVTTYSSSTLSTSTSGIMYLLSICDANPLPGLGSRVLMISHIPWTSLTDMPISFAITDNLLLARSSRCSLITFSKTSVSCFCCLSCMMRHSARSLAPTPIGSKVCISLSTFDTFSSSEPIAAAISSVVAVIYPFSSRDSMIYFPILRQSFLGAAN